MQKTAEKVEQKQAAKEAKAEAKAAKKEAKADAKEAKKSRAEINKDYNSGNHSRTDYLRTVMDKARINKLREDASHRELGSHKRGVGATISQDEYDFTPAPKATTAFINKVQNTKVSDLSSAPKNKRIQAILENDDYEWRPGNWRDYDWGDD